MSTVKSISVAFSDLATGGSSHKIYSLRLEKNGSAYFVNYEHGPIGGTQQSGTKTKEGTDLEEADHIYETVLREKLKKGYQPTKAVAPAPVAAPQTILTMRTPWPIEDLEEVPVESVESYLNSPRYWLQTKNDGHFRQIQKTNGSFVGFNKLGGLVPDLPAEIVADLRKIKAKSFFMAGELMGNRYVAENLLELDGTVLTSKPYAERFEELEGIIQAKARHVTITATWRSREEKREGWKALEARRAEGGCFKCVTAAYQSGASGNHFKAKFVKSLSALVVGKGHKGHNSATIALYDSGKVIEVGRCSLNGKEHVEVGHVIEVAYLYATAGKRLYQPRLNEIGTPPSAIRKDVDPKKCTVAQLIYKEGVDA